ncbi:MAG TPA: asparagine synthase (glutamine-hydrolyzing) [Candidimonas sp.]|nr:asparagine synthase (glutamine-hydrolyzing) [Candidimonas sp.]
MCGITGFFQQHVSDPEMAANIKLMSARLTHRGPDDSGHWVDDTAGLALGHRRLSILDLSPAGHQPMTSSDGRLVIAFNGEIYNHLDLRRQLGSDGVNPKWRGHSDTETLLACFCAWGVERTLQACVGMFAFALWDRGAKSLTLARDRMGEKPLYWGWQGNVLLFGSELKALKAHPACSAQIDRNSLALLLRHGYIPSPYSIYEGIGKLRPGHMLSIPLASGKPVAMPDSQAYWRLNDVVAAGLAHPFSRSDSDAIDALEAQLSQSINAQMLADVPVGAFLSGGIDSSTIVSLMQAQSSRPIKTFTVGFAEGENDESIHAKAVARHLGTDHTELHVSARDALDVIPKLAAMYCEPLSADSQIPTFLLSQIARKHVAVALSGDGGDELFGGYNRYLNARKVWGQMQRLPLSARRAAAKILRLLPPPAWDRLFEAIKPALPSRLHIAIPGTKAQKLADVLELSSEDAYFSRLTSHWQDPASILIGGNEPPTILTSPEMWPKTDSFEHWMMAMDAQTFLPEEVLVKVDRAAMACSLEARTPMLDHRVVELAWGMPLSMKIRNGQGKWLLRQVLYRHVPKKLIERPKAGFGIPIDAWLRGPLREWAESLLDEKRLTSEGYFHAPPVRTMWLEHLSGRYNWQYQLWPILVFQAWLIDNR